MGRGRRFGTHHHGGRGARCRWLTQPGTWEVHARVERFVEPALLLVLRDGETHGYDLADSLAEPGASTTTIAGGEAKTRSPRSRSSSATWRRRRRTSPSESGG